MTILFANNAATSLAAGLAAADLSFTVAAGEGALFPDPDPALGEYFLCTLVGASSEPEIVKVTSRSVDVFTIERAQESTSARDFEAGDRVELRLTAGGLDGFIQSGHLEPATAGAVKGVRYVSAASSITDHGDLSAEGSLAQVLAQLGGAPAAVELPGDRVYALATDLATPDNVSLRFQPGAVLEPALGVTLTLNCRIEAGRQPILSGQGDVAGGLQTPAIPQWFGAVGDGVTDDTEAITRALAFPLVHVPVGVYAISQPLPLLEGAHIEGETFYAGYIDWVNDFQQSLPTYAGRAAVIQYVSGQHGAIFTSASRTSFRNMVFRSGQVRTTEDVFFSVQANHVSIRDCRFENLEYVITDPAQAQEFGALNILGSTFVACGRIFRGVLTDSIVQGCHFTSNETPFHLTTGAGLNIIDGNRFEWNTRAILGYESRTNIISNNLFDASDEAALYLLNSTDWNITGNVFWRNGRDGSAVGKRAHIHLKGSSLSGNRISDNTFLSGHPDGDPPAVWPKYIVEVEGAASTYTIFTDNDTINGCVEMPVLDTYYSSPDALTMDAVHIRSIGDPDGVSDSLNAMCRNIAKVAVSAVEVHLYENRRWPNYLDVEPGKIRLVGHGGVTLTNDGGAANSILSMHNLTYGRTYGDPPAAGSADNAPSAGYWEQGSVVWNTAPVQAGVVGWVCIEAGEPGEWRPFGMVRESSGAAPTAGVWSQGDVVWNTSPDAGEVVGWVCVAGGEPGEWSGFGRLDGLADSFPVTGTWAKGALVWNSDPDNLEYVGWVCIEAGTPGAWKGFGEIPVATPGIPTAGTWSKGDRVWNSDPDAGEYVGWVCVVAGTPGAWKGFGLIQT